MMTPVAPWYPEGTATPIAAAVFEPAGGDKVNGFRVWRPRPENMLHGGMGKRLVGEVNGEAE